MSISVVHAQWHDTGCLFPSAQFFEANECLICHRDCLHCPYPGQWVLVAIIMTALDFRHSGITPHCDLGSTDKPLPLFFIDHSQLTYPFSIFRIRLFVEYLKYDPSTCKNWVEKSKWKWIEIKQEGPSGVQMPFSEDTNFCFGSNKSPRCFPL